MASSNDPHVNQTKATPPPTVTPVNLTKDTPLDPSDHASTFSPIETFKTKIGDTQNDLKQVFGLIDFGDLCLSRYVFELATSVAFMMIYGKREDFIQVGKEVIQGYQSVCPLSENELEVVYVAVCAHYVKKLVLSEVEARLHPENSVYLYQGFKQCWPQLRTLRDIGKDRVLAIWRGK